ncbi:peptidase S9 prolyl oligopeptidase active site domain protein [Obelidium mucronatum]|nr:peptidase S9 prolyl oligopeptidase active site domain protein [Obelidium mucronatum]
MDTSKPYGRFTSPITTDSFAAAAIGISMLVPDKQQGVLYHVETRPNDGGRAALVVEGAEDAAGFSGVSLRTSVHEYGGAPAAALGGAVVFADAAAGGGVFVADSKANKKAKTKVRGLATRRFADFAVHPTLRCAVCVQESHAEDASVLNSLVLISLNSEEPTEPTVIASGKDFYTAPRFSTDGSHLAWIEWNLPAMPWTQSSLHLAEFNIETGRLESSRTIASGPFSVSQPRWSPTQKGHLIFASDESGYYNLYQYDIISKVTKPLLKTPHIGDFSFPDWELGQQKYDFLPNGNVIAGHSNKDGTGSISVIDPTTQTMTTLATGHIVESLCTINERVFIVSGTPLSPIGLSQVVLNETFDQVVEFKLIKSTTDGLKGLNPAKWISVAESIEFPTENGLTAFGYFYAPKNPNHAPPNASDKPPLRVLCHGGPTAASDNIVSPKIQYWTSRGWAVFDINYGGSCGYGREYRERLDGNWGIVDVADVCNGALHLAKLGKVDRNRLCIAGGSAGGFTTLAALTFRPDVFAAGASSYGICDLKSLAELTHKFESKYLDIILGTTHLSDSEIQELYRTRSPINFVDNIRVPLLVLQGSLDRVVPVEQAEKIVEAIRKRNGVVGYELFEGEGHGWKKGENIKRSVEVEMEFYLKAFGI